MFIKKTTKKYKGKPYNNYLLVESVSTPKGPRHVVVCSLGNLAPAPFAEWLAWARKVEARLSGQLALRGDVEVDAVARRVRARAAARTTPADTGVAPGDTDIVAVCTDQVTVEEAREAGPVHVGHQMWRKLGLDEILAEAGLSERARRLTEVMTLNRFIAPSSEHAMPDWICRSALPDILGADLASVYDEALYRNMDRLHPQRTLIEKKLSERERTLFNLDDSVYLYDLTSTYFEGQCLLNPQAKRGYSRDKRPDCKQVVVGLVIDRDGFPRAHEVFDGNRQDRTTVEAMLTVLEQRVGKRPGGTVIVDRGMAYAENLEQIRSRGYHYIVASRQGERNDHLPDFLDEDGWADIERVPSPQNPAQKKTRVRIKQRVVGEEVHVLCHSDGRESKDRAIREKHERRLVADLLKLEARIAAGRLVKEAKIQQAIGRLRQRHARVARYYDIAYDAKVRSLIWAEDAARKQQATELDGAYLLKTDRKDLTGDEIWRTYMLLTRVESAFRSMKSPLMERPIWHHLEHRVQTHIFLCVLAYHLLVATERMFLDRQIHTSWATLRAQLATHQVVTVVLPTATGLTLRIRKGTTPEPEHREIYSTLQITSEIMPAVRTWSSP
jgi:transposase